MSEKKAELAGVQPLLPPEQPNPAGGIEQDPSDGVGVCREGGAGGGGARPPPSVCSGKK